jgi:hypothetical protein
MLVVFLLFAALVLLIDLPLPPEGLRLISRGEKIGADAFWSALYAGAIAGLVTGVIAGVVTGLFVHTVEVHIQDRREKWEIETTINTAAYRVLERLESIAAPCGRLLDLASAEPAVASPSVRQAIADNLRLANHEKWWLGGDLDSYRDAINPHKGSGEVETLPEHERLQRRIRQEILLQPEIRTDSVAAFKVQVDACRAALRDLVGDVAPSPSAALVDFRSLPGSGPEVLAPGAPSPFPAVDQTAARPASLLKRALLPFAAGLVGAACGLLLLRLRPDGGRRRH